MPSRILPSRIVGSRIVGSRIVSSRFADAGEGDIPYLLRDDFTDTRAAGSVNGTLAIPTGGARTATDSANKMAIGSGVMSTTANTGGGDPGIWYPAITRVVGRTLLAKYKTDTSVSFAIGFDDDTTGVISKDSVIFRIGGLRLSAQGFDVGAYDLNVQYAVAIVLRAIGALEFIKGGAFTNWTLLYPDKAGNGLPATIYPAVASNNIAGSVVSQVDTVRIPVQPVVVSPIASDAFTRADGALGTAGGGGSEEAGGTGRAWVSGAGTWGVATNKAAASALTGGIANAVVDCGSANVIAEGVVTRSAGNAGLLLRYTDESNYIKAYLDGTNLVVVEIVAGTPNTLQTTAVTYGATKRTIISATGTKLRVYYGEAIVGSELTTAITTGNSHGLHTSNTGATFDNFVVWAKGNGGEYSFLNKF